MLVMSTSKPTSVDDDTSSLELDFGAKRIAKRLFKNDDKKHQRKVEHLAIRESNSATTAKACCSAISAGSGSRLGLTKALLKNTEPARVAHGPVFEKVFDWSSSALFTLKPYSFATPRAVPPIRRLRNATRAS
jgi:hypothetical protein